ncbi:MAG: hypothetical protein DRQ62_00090 [Gammaproteobacteria bacterium]|nr:MAG: hypothetical protein DRQ62_00090 [Gammaproteobacteria bacterium]
MSGKDNKSKGVIFTVEGLYERLHHNADKLVEGMYQMLLLWLEGLQLEYDINKGLKEIDDLNDDYDEFCSKIDNIPRVLSIRQVTKILDSM